MRFIYHINPKKMYNASRMYGDGIAINYMKGGVERTYTIKVPSQEGILCISTIAPNCMLNAANCPAELTTCEVNPPGDNNIVKCPGHPKFVDDRAWFIVVDTYIQGKGEDVKFFREDAQYGRLNLSEYTSQLEKYDGSLFYDECLFEKSIFFMEVFYLVARKFEYRASGGMCFSLCRECNDAWKKNDCSYPIDINDHILVVRIKHKVEGLLCVSRIYEAKNNYYTSWADLIERHCDSQSYALDKESQRSEVSCGCTAQPEVLV